MKEIITLDSSKLSPDYPTPDAPYVLLLNGSPHDNGNTYNALMEVARTLAENDVSAVIVNLGREYVGGCSACYACSKLGRCVRDDIVNKVARMFENADGLILGSPVYYASPNGNLLSILDRLFYSSHFDKTMKIGASVVVARRGGCSASFDALNKYFTISGMPIVSSNYWNQVHGGKGEETEQDLEGLQTMRVLGRNAAFLIKAIRLAKESGSIPFPEREKKIMTNFLR